MANVIMEVLYNVSNVQSTIGAGGNIDNLHLLVSI